MIDAIGKPFPIPRAGKAEEIATAFLYFASDEAAYTTGQTLAVDSGAALGDLIGI